MWCRLVPHGAATYPRRPTKQWTDPVEDVLARISFADPIREARFQALSGASSLGRAPTSRSTCAKASPARDALASWTRIMALTAMKDLAAQPEAHARRQVAHASADAVTSANPGPATETAPARARCGGLSGRTRARGTSCEGRHPRLSLTSSWWEATTFLLIAAQGGDRLPSSLHLFRRSRPSSRPCSPLI